MTAELGLLLFSLLITDIINPVLFAGVLFTLGTHHPFRNTSWLLLSFFITYFLSGLVLAIGMEEITHYLQNPTTFDYTIELLLAPALILFAWHIRKTKDYQHDPHFNHPAHLTLPKALFIGAQINFIGLPLALPYFVAIDRILIANLSEAATATILLLYNIGYILPFAAMMLLRALLKEQSDPIFQKINRVLLKISDILLPFILIGIGILLFIDAGLYFINRI